MREEKVEPQYEQLGISAPLQGDSFSIVRFHFCGRIYGKNIDTTVYMVSNKEWHDGL